ncbi:hypothetical protein [uncultured Rikenella sp.]|uniref:hypothetical protein n=1 Tax=uncultured Rikenella sp. TaxID=368003 RepID=UPI0025ED5822|nr:hypothetical protein [uncultured Rikenella sp.]
MPSGTAPGFRYNADGVPRSVGDYGCCYSASVSGIYGIFLFASTGGHNSRAAAHGRAFSLPLRCLSE